MRYLIASDIHGSAFWCEKLLDHYHSIKPDRLILLGDILYHGPRNDLPKGYAPKEVISLLNPLSSYISACRGNCEAEVDQMVLNFNVMDDYTELFDGDRTLFCTHGHIYNPDNLPCLTAGDIFLYGHTHIKDNRIENGIQIFNPGSVSIPKDGSNSIGLYEEGKIRHILL